MILHWSFLAISFIIKAISIIFSGTVGAILAYYSIRSNDPYANSIRWSRKGGFYEMLTLLRHSYRRLSTTGRFTMIGMIFAQVFALFMAILLGKFVSSTYKATPAPPTIVITGQQPPTQPLQWTDWTVFMDSNVTIEDTLVLLLNNTRFNPDNNFEAVYTPRKYDYVVPCNETSIALGIHDQNKPPGPWFSYPSPHNNCALLFSLLESTNSSYTWDIKSATNQPISAGEHMVVAPIFYDQDFPREVVPSLSIFNGHNCESSIANEERFKELPEDGITTVPNTYTVRCQYNTSDSVIVASTYIKFVVNHLKDFSNVTTLVVDDPSELPLLQSMDVAINNGTFLNPTNNATVVILTKVADNVDFLVCASSSVNRTSDMALVCTYIMTALIITRPQQWDPLTPAAFSQAVPLPSLYGSDMTNRNEFTIYHMPPVGSRDNKFKYSASHLLKATTGATEYLASLGHNVLLNQQTEQIYVLYDTVVLKSAYEVPLPLVIFLGVVSLICLGIWWSSERRLTVFNGSLYKIIYQEIEKKDEIKSMIMDCTYGPLAFEGRQVIPDSGKDSVPLSEEPLMGDQDNRSSETTLHMVPIPPQSQQATPFRTVAGRSSVGPVAHSPVAHSPVARSTATALVPSPTLASPTVSHLAVPSVQAELSPSSVQRVGPADPPPIPARPLLNDPRPSTNSVHPFPRSVSSPTSGQQSTPSSPPPPTRFIPPPQSVALIDNPFQ